MSENEGSLSSRLWNDRFAGEHTPVAPDQYHSLILEQYKLYSEMADRVSARRGAANTYFLTLNTALTTVLATLMQGLLADVPVWFLACGTLLLLVECGAWFAIVRSYRLLNEAKYKVIAAMEERLPARAYSRAEWTALGEGRDWRRYLPMSHIEQGVPVVFATVYLLGFFALMS